MEMEQRAETPPKLDMNITPLMETPKRRDINADPFRPEINVMECIRDLRNTPPPYWCPVENCRREYQSLCGLQYHLQKINHKSAAIIKKSPFGGRRKGHHRTPVHTRVQKTPEVLPTPTREGLTYAEAQRMVEFDLDGCAVRVSIFDPIQIVDITGMDVPEPVSEDKDAVVPSIDVKPENKAPLNEPMFQEIDSYEISDAPPMPNSYIRFIERSVDEVDMEVEYDMDEEDIAWLELINEQRTNSNVTHVSVDVFELLMDRLEKESYFQMQILGKSGEDSGIPFIDEDAVCCICMDGECQNSNVILFCDMCNLAVHQDCYGVPYIPEGQWMCRRCLQSPSRTVDCVLCPTNGGAFKQTDRGHWAHVVCALWIPEVRFANTVFLEPIDSIEMIPPARWKLTCYICKQRGVGACIQCHKNNCYAAFHVTCAQHAGLYMKMETVQDPRAKDPAQIMVQKTAFCDTHTPADAEIRPHISNLKARLLPQAPASVLISSQDVDQKNSLNDCKDKDLSSKEMESKRSKGGGTETVGGGTPKNEHMVKEKGKKDASEKSNDMSVSEMDQKHKLKSVRKSDGKKPSAAPIISIPTIPPDRIQDIASLANIPKKNQFMQRLVAYWTLKRRMRNGVPLLRRLQNNHLSRKDDSRPLQEGEMYKQLKYWQRLRQDLERVRLLCELVRKREKLKNELCKTKQRCLEMELQSFIYFLRTLHDLIRAKDVGGIFLEPVDQTEVLDYADVVKHPMDLSTMRKKIDDFRYSNLDDYITDFNLMIDNCMAYNSRDTVFYKAAAKMRDQCNPIFIQARKDVETSGFNSATGMLITDKAPSAPCGNNIPKNDGRSSPPSSPPASPPSPTLEEVMRKDIDDEIAIVLDKSNEMPASKRLNKLLSLLNRIDKMKNAVARSYRQRRIKTEVRNLRRAMAMSRSAARRRRVVPKRPILVKEKSESDSEREDSSDDDKPLIRLPLRQPLDTTVSTTKSTETLQPVTQAPRQSGRRSISNATSESSNFPSKSDVSTPKTETEPQKEAVTRSTGKRGRPKKLSVDKMAESTNVSKSDLPIANDQHSSTPLGVKEQKLASSSLNSSKDLSIEPQMQLSSLPSGVNRRTAVLFTRKAKAAAAFKKPERTDTHLDKSLGKMGTSTPISAGRRRVGRPRKNPLPDTLSAQHITDTSLTSTPGDLNSLPISASFQVYRNQTDISVNTDTEEEDEMRSKSSLTCTSSTDDSCDSSDASSCSGYMQNSACYSSAEDSREGMLSQGDSEDSMEPLDLVWAKCRGYPWYPALIIDPKMPRTGYLHNGVPIPAPPLDVLALGANYNEPVYLVLFFDNKRTWQWLPRNKLERLGVDREVDREKLFQSRKPADRKAVKKAFDDAMAHNNQVSGLNRQGRNSDDSMSGEPFDPEDM